MGLPTPEVSAMVSIQRQLLQRLRFPVFAALSTIAVACVFQKPVVTQLKARNTPQQVQSPVKAHMYDGSTVVFPQGAILTGDRLLGTGERYMVGSSVATPADGVSLDSIVGMETFSRDVNVPLSVVASGAALAAGAFGTALAAIAIFGSCPTFYADSAGVELLQAEGFSYSIAPLFEQRDVDRLRLTATPDGKVVLKVRNEALETHYINHLELVEIQHDADEMAFPDQRGIPVTVRNPAPAALVRDRNGRDVTRLVQSIDDEQFATSDLVLRNINAADLDDHIDFAVPYSAGADSIAIVLDLRNSLLNTVLLYQKILGDPGLKSLDWLTKDLSQISKAVDMGRWYASNMGMRVSIRDGATYRQVVKIGDSGPIAYHQVALIVPALKGRDDSVHIRLSFVADDWRIDAIGVAQSWRRPISRTIPVSRVAMADPAQNASAGTSLRDPDTSYLITGPGQSFRAEFDVGADGTQRRTWFLASQGYYSEWVRGSWIKAASGKPFIASNETLVDAIREWRHRQPEMERQFYSSRISAR